MHSNCRHILQTLPCATPPPCFSFSDNECLPSAHLSYSFVDSVTGSLQYVGYPTSSLPIYHYQWHNMWDTPQVLCPFITISDPICGIPHKFLAHLSLSVTQYVGYPTSSLPIYHYQWHNMWDTPQVPCPFITISDTILFIIPALCCHASVISQHLTSSNAELYSCIAVYSDHSSFLCF